MKFTYKNTLFACYLSYITQAIVNNISPLLFVLFRDLLGISLWQISLLITLNFITQIAIDFTGTFFIDRIGYRATVIIACSLATCGLICLGLLPILLSHTYAALLTATLLSAIGGGLIEVVISPTVEALPGEEKSGTMSILHSFYCWGQVGVVLLSTLYLHVFGSSSWYLLPIFWSLVPFAALLLFCRVPMRTLGENGATKSVGALCRTRAFWLLMVLMLCAGGSELAMSQWASMFAEKGLGVSKTIGDLLGPCCFAVLMGCGRLLYGLFGHGIRLEKWLLASNLLCLFSYLLTALAQNPFLSLFGCALCGLSVALMWPGTYSVGAQRIPDGGTTMFALFALAGDIGCALGPDIVGTMCEAVEGGRPGLLSHLITGSPTEIGMKSGMLLMTAFPIVAIAFTLPLLKRDKKRADPTSRDRCAPNEDI